MSLFPFTSPKNTDAEKLSCLRLYRTKNVGTVLFQKLTTLYGSAEAAIEQIPEMAKRGGRQLSVCTKDDAEREINALYKLGGQLITYNDSAYPEKFKELENMPPVLSIIGNADLLNTPTLAVVGARNASLSGRKITETLSREMGNAGYTIASGLARGIDTCAHQTALDTGTIAVIAGGVDVIYPPENEKLYCDIKERGLILAESPIGVQPIRQHFPKRNVLISALSLGVLVIEAGLKSGTMITAREALDQNREVFAVPGSPLDPRSQGSNALIKDQAYMVTHVDDILHVLKSNNQQPLSDCGDNSLNDPIPLGTQSDTHSLSDVEMNSLRETILGLLSLDPVHIDDVLRHSNAPYSATTMALFELELAGRIARVAGNKVHLNIE